VRDIIYSPVISRHPGLRCLPRSTRAGLFLDPSMALGRGKGYSRALSPIRTISSQPGFIPLMSRINIWTVIAILLVLFAVTRYLMHERETSLICAKDPSAAECQR
jgi:hypothetical protein